MSPSENVSGRLDRLEAVHQIEQLAFRYALAFDSRDVETLQSLWTAADVPAKYPDINIHTVRNEFDPWLYGLGPSVLFVGNHVIDILDADHASGSVYCFGQLDMGESFIDQTILYEDRYRREGDRWLFEVRRHQLWFGVPREVHPMKQPDANWPASPVGRGTLPESFPSYQRFMAQRPSGK
jgi:hypothetical protein